MIDRKQAGTHAFNATMRQRHKNRELETLICRLWYHIEFGAYDPQTFEQLKLDTKAALGVRPLWKRKYSGNAKMNFEPWNIKPYVVQRGDGRHDWRVIERETGDVFALCETRQDARAKANILNFKSEYPLSKDVTKPWREENDDAQIPSDTDASH